MGKGKTHRVLNDGNPKFEADKRISQQCGSASLELNIVCIYAFYIWGVLSNGEKPTDNYCYRIDAWRRYCDFVLKNK